MIEAKDLRIGNLVTYHGDADMYCVLDAQDILNISTGYMENDKLHSPILLTEDWLLKFKVNTSATAWEIAYEKRANGRYAVIYNHEPITEIEFIHELQNLHFIIEGEELTIK